MENVTTELLCSLYGHKDRSICSTYAPLIDNFCGRYLITGIRLAAFLAQVGHESARLKVLSENLNYSAQALRKTFPKKFPTDTIAQQYARKPKDIANRVYAGKNGNGDEASGDGWYYRGRGLIQITGKDNYRNINRDMGDGNYDFLRNPDLLCIPRFAVESACVWWYKHNLNQLADAGQFSEMTRRINGGYNGMQDREFLFAEAKKLLSL